MAIDYSRCGIHNCPASECFERHYPQAHQRCANVCCIHNPKEPVQRGR